MKNVNRCIFLDNKHNMVLKQCKIPMPADNEVLINIKANGICGSDIHFFVEGKLGDFVVTNPYIPGHESSGIIVKAGKLVKNFKPGDKGVIEPGIPCMHCAYCKSGRYNLCLDVKFLSAPPTNGTFCDYICVRSDFVFKVPKTMPFEHAAMVEPTAVAVHAVNRAKFMDGSAAAIFGAGPIGILTMQAFKASGGGKVTCIDVLDSRLKFAKQMGADEVVNGKNCSEIVNIADTVFETAGCDDTTGRLFQAVRLGGCAVQVGWPRSDQVAMNISSFITKELTYVGVNRYCNAYPTALQYISDGRIRVDEMISRKFKFEDTPEAFKFAHENAEEVIKIIVIN